MNATEIRSSPWKAVLRLGGSLIFVVTALVMLRHPDGDAWKAWLGLVFFGLCAVVFAVMLFRPPRLLLDPDGFALAGGLIRAPKKVLWADVDEFLIYRLPRGGKMIGYNYTARAREALAKPLLKRRFFPDRTLPTGWTQSPEKVVAQLNARRLGTPEPREATVTGPARSVFGRLSPR